MCSVSALRIWPSDFQRPQRSSRQLSFPIAHQPTPQCMCVCVCVVCASSARHQPAWHKHFLVLALARIPPSPQTQIPQSLSLYISYFLPLVHPTRSFLRPRSERGDPCCLFRVSWSVRGQLRTSWRKGTAGLSFCMIRMLHILLFFYLKLAGTSSCGSCALVDKRLDRACNYMPGERSCLRDGKYLRGTERLISLLKLIR